MFLALWHFLRYYALLAGYVNAAMHLTVYKEMSTLTWSISYIEVIECTLNFFWVACDLLGMPLLHFISSHQFTFQAILGSIWMSTLEHTSLQVGRNGLDSSVTQDSTITHWISMVKKSNMVTTITRTTWLISLQMTAWHFWSSQSSIFPTGIVHYV